MSILNFLVSITCFFLSLFSVHLFLAKSPNKKQHILLSTLLFARSGQILVSLLMHSDQHRISYILFQVFTPLYFVAPACFYLYITGFLNREQRLSKKEWLHFLPAVLAVIHVVPWPGSPQLDWNIITSQFNENGYLSLKSRSGLFPGYFHYLFRPALTITYLCLAWLAVVKSKILQEPARNNSRRSWALFILRAATFFQLLGLTRILLKGFDIPLFNSFFIFLNCMVLLGILLYALHRPYIFYGFLLVAADWDMKGYNRTVESQSEDNSPNIQPQLRSSAISAKKINITDGQLEAYIILMKNAMEVECLFLNPELQIIDLATKINIPVHHCSYVINNHIGKNFRDWINGYRVNHFLKQYFLVKDKMTIEAIAQEAGFKNQATFYNAFKKEKGEMPTVYISKEMSL